MKLRKWALLLPIIFLVSCGRVNETVTETENVKAVDENSSDSHVQSKEITEFKLSQNLNTAITELALMYDNFDLSKIEEDGYPQSFIFHFCQNSRLTFDYLEQLREEKNGILSVEDVQYIQQSLTNEMIDFGDEVPREGIDSNQTASGLGFGNILSYEADVLGEEVHLVATYERGIDEFQPARLYELNIVLVQNPESCFDGYSIKSLTSKDITPLINGDNKKHIFRGYDLEVEENGIFTFEYYGGDDEIEYDTHIIIDLSQNALLADYIRENAGEEFEVTYILDDTMTQPVYRVVPVRINLYNEDTGMKNVLTE